MDARCGCLFSTPASSSVAVPSSCRCLVPADLRIGWVSVPYARSSWRRRWPCFGPFVPRFLLRGGEVGSGLAVELLGWSRSAECWCASPASLAGRGGRGGCGGRCILASAWWWWRLVCGVLSWLWLRLLLPSLAGRGGEGEGRMECCLELLMDGATVAASPVERCRAEEEAGWRI